MKPHTSLSISSTYLVLFRGHMIVYGFRARTMAGKWPSDTCFHVVHTETGGRGQLLPADGNSSANRGLGCLNDLPANLRFRII